MALETRVFFDTQSLSYSDVAPIKQFSNNLRGPAIKGGIAAFSASDVSLGQSIKFASRPGVFQYAFFYRMDYSLKFSPDTAMLVYADENDVPLDPDKTYDLYLKANHISARGLRVNYSQGFLDRFHFNIGLSYLYADSMIYGSLSGDLNSLESNAEGHVNVDYFYTEDLLFDREKNDYSANGYALDFSFDWAYSNRIEIAFEGKDLFSHIDWRHQDQTVAVASTDRIGIDERGRARARAALSWQELNADANQKLPQQFLLNETYKLTQKDTIALEHFSYDGEVFHRLGYRRLINRHNSVYVYYDATAEAIGLDLNTKYLNFGVFSDSFDLEEAKIFGVMLTTNAVFHL